MTLTASSGVFSATWLLVAIPLFSAAILLISGRRADKWGHYLGVAAPLASFVLGVVLFFSLIGKNADGRHIDNHLFSWVPVAGFRANANFLIDPLSICFVLLITGVGSLIH
ncbi:MAG TPA: NADH-quinone oxidoreductase subunit L, partial [Acidothermaceae bacterium]